MCKIIPIIVLSSLLALAKAEDVPDFLAQNYLRDKSSPDEATGKHDHDIASDKPIQNADARIPLCRCRSKVKPIEQAPRDEGAQPKDMPTSGNITVGEVVRRHETWARELAMPQVLEDSGEHKYKRVFQRYTYVPPHLRKPEDSKRNRRHLGDLPEPINNLDDTNHDLPFIVDVNVDGQVHIRQRRDVPNDITGIDDFINEENKEGGGNNEKTEVRNKEATEKTESTKGCEPCREYDCWTTRSQDVWRDDNDRYDDETVDPDTGMVQGIVKDADKQRDNEMDANEDANVKMKDGALNKLEGDDVPSTTIDYLNQVTLSPPPSELRDILAGKIFRHAIEVNRARSTSSDKSRAIEGATDEFVVPPKLTSPAAYPHNAAKVYHEFDEIMNWLQTKTKVRQQVENTETKVNAGADDETGETSTTAQDYLDIAENRINANAEAAQKWAEEYKANLLKEEQEAKAAYEAQGKTTTEETYTSRTWPAVSSISGDEEDEDMKHFIPNEAAPDTKERPEPEKKVNINSVKYQYMELRKKYKEENEETTNQPIRERIQLLKESYKHKYRELSKKTLREVEDYGADKTEELAHFPHEWYQKNKQKVRTLKELEEEDRREDEERVAREALCQTRKHVMRTIRPTGSNAEVKSRKKRATKVLLRKNNQTFVVSYKHLNLLRRKNVRIYLNHEHLRKFDFRKKRHINIMMMGRRKERSQSDSDTYEGEDGDEIREIIEDGGHKIIETIQDKGSQINLRTVNEQHILDDDDLVVKNKDSVPDDNLIELTADDIIDSNYGNADDIITEKEAGEDNVVLGTNENASKTSTDITNDNTETKVISTGTTQRKEIITHNMETLRDNADQPVMLKTESVAPADQNTGNQTQNTIHEDNTTVLDTKSSIHEEQTEDQATINKDINDIAVNVDENHIPLLIRKKRGDADFIYVTKPKRSWKDFHKKKIRYIKNLLSTKFRDRVYEWTTKHKWETLPDEKDRTTPTFMTKKFLDYKKLHRMGYGK